MKKPGEFKKKKKKFKNIQHNRDQLKLLRENKVENAELFILDPDGFKKVTIIQIDDNSIISGDKVVYLHNHGKGSKLRTGILILKDGFKIDKVPGGHIDPKYVYGVVIKEELLQRANHLKSF